MSRSFASVSRVQARLRKLLEPALGARPFWIRAELSSVNLRKGRMYCDLVETRNGEVIAKLRCMIWDRDLSTIRSRLREAQLDGILSDGNEVGLACRIQYHQLYGMSVQAVDIDPRESLGALERKRLEILQRLQREGLVGRNAQHSVPHLPRRVGLIASRGTAGYQDFLATLESSAFGLCVLAADARVEGDATEPSVLRALHCLDQLEVDVVVLLRGGGSRLSLSYLDNEAIARAIAAYRHPVWTAIGHEIDTSVLDEVAARSFKTPTAAAEELVSRYLDAEKALRKAALTLRTTARLRLRPERARVNRAGEGLRASALRALREREQIGRARAGRFHLLADKRLGAELTRVSAARSTLQAAGRTRVLVASRSLDEHRKSLHKTVGRSLRYRREVWGHLRQRLASPSRLERVASARRRYRDLQKILRAADPLRNLERGYALVRKKEGALVRSIDEVPEGTALVTTLFDGELESTVIGKKEQNEREGT